MSVNGIMGAGCVADQSMAGIGQEVNTRCAGRKAASRLSGPKTFLKSATDVGHGQNTNT